MERKYLTQPEVQSLISMAFPSVQLNMVRDMFIFCCFTSLSLLDLKNLHKRGIENSQWINITYSKSGIRARIPLLPIPQMIYDKYIWKTWRTFIFPVYSINRFNHDMRQIGKVSNIGKNLTFLTVRNTFAYLASTYGISFETIYKMMGYRDMILHGNFYRQAIKAF
jgi:hypothetical protein